MLNEKISKNYWRRRALLKMSMNTQLDEKMVLMTTEQKIDSQGHSQTSVSNNIIKEPVGLINQRKNKQPQRKGTGKETPRISNETKVSKDNKIYREISAPDKTTSNVIKAETNLRQEILQKCPAKYKFCYKYSRRKHF